MVKQCKGFWNMCSCPKCCKADRDLDKVIANPEKKMAAVGELLMNHSSLGRILRKGKPHKKEV